MKRTSAGSGPRVAEVASFSFSLPDDLEQAVRQAQRKWDSSQGTERLWQKDASLWTNTDEGQWLGWLEIADRQRNDISKFQALAAEIRDDGFTHVLLLGMGGSSLASEVFSTTFGKQERVPQLLVLDSTDPMQIRSMRAKIDPARTLFCVSSKSGTTLEPNLFLQYFFEEAQKAVGERAGHNFIAVTDPGSKLEGLAEKLGFRRLYHGDAHVGGRYSALSDFGLVPHAAMGLDTERLLKRVALMEEACKSPDSDRNPGVSLGLVLGTAAAEFGRDKVTLICSKSICDLGAWLEQLLAESTGKNGKGLIPINREPLLEASEYGDDRLFTYIKYVGDHEAQIEAQITAIENTGFPVVRLLLSDLYDIGQSFFQWEIATAVAGSLLGLNPFNQPDVEASKNVTRELTSEFDQNGSFPPETPILEQDGVQLFADKKNVETLLKCGNTLGAALRQHLDRIHPGDYFALLAYIPMFPEYEQILQKLRRDILEGKQVATVLGFGPRFLHNTGQAYKGGPNTGVFLQITCDEPEDLPVPHQRYTFGMVQEAQARGDFQVMTDRGRRVLRVHLKNEIATGLHHLRDLICAAIAH